jgi:hypothetical protein
MQPTGHSELTTVDTLSEVEMKLDAIARRVELYETKKFKKLPAKQTLTDFKFLFYLITVLNEVAGELKARLDSMDPTLLVDLTGKAIATHAPQEPLIAAAP